MIEYIRNDNPKHRSLLHVRVDGMSSEPCNLDQIKRSVITTEIPTDNLWSWCARCRVSAGRVSAGVAQ